MANRLDRRGCWWRCGCSGLLALIGLSVCVYKHKTKAHPSAAAGRGDRKEEVQVTITHELPSSSSHPGDEVNGQERSKDAIISDHVSKPVPRLQARHDGGRCNSTSCQGLVVRTLNRPQRPFPLSSTRLVSRAPGSATQLTQVDGKRLRWMLREWTWAGREQHRLQKRRPALPTAQVLRRRGGRQRARRARAILLQTRNRAQARMH